ncbi:hypothetical protein J3B00_003420 [Pseudomonas sp. BP8]|nr:hypothetical protein [Pseudomonas sp. BP8]
MLRFSKSPFYLVSVPLIAMGAAFAAVGVSGQSAFGWTAAGLLMPGAVLLICGALRHRRQQQSRH